MKTKRVLLPLLFAVCAVVFSVGTCYAADAPSRGPASPFPVKVNQPDGTEIEIFVRGDESCNWTETPTGYSVVKNERSGFWEYALLEIRAENGVFRLALAPSGVVYRTGHELPDGWPKGLQPTRMEMRPNK